MSGALPDAGLLALYEDAPCGFAVTQPDGTVLHANRTLLAWTGRAAGEPLGGWRFQDLLTVPGRIVYENQVFPLLRVRGEAHGVALDLARPGHDPLPALVSATRARRAAADPELVAVTVFDATDRRTYERELLRTRRAAEQLAAVVAASPDAILSLSPAGDIQAWNAGAERLFGWGAAEAAGRPATIVVPPDRRDEHAAVLAAVALGGRVEGAETACVARDGRRIDVSLSAAPVRDADGAVVAYAWVARDVTAQKRAEAALRAAAAAEEAGWLRTAFLRTMTHELRTPLTAILGYAELMRASLGALGLAADAADAEQILRSGEHLLALVDDVLVLSRLQAGGVELDVGPVDLAGAAAEVAAALAPEAAAKGIALAVDVPAGLAVEADHLRLRQVLLNLAGNAVKFTDRGGVRIAARAAAGGVEVAVCDTGIGIAPEALAHVFDEFHQADGGTTRKHGGSGLGLAIAKRLVEAHGGAIRAESAPGAGTTFTVALPAVPMARAAET